MRDLQSRLASADLKAADAARDAEAARREEAAARERADQALFQLASAVAKARHLEKGLARRTEEARSDSAFTCCCGLFALSWLSPSCDALILYHFLTGCYFVPRYFYLSCGSCSGA